jgi:hypothetical protein
MRVKVHTATGTREFSKQRHAVGRNGQRVIEAAASNAAAQSAKKFKRPHGTVFGCELVRVSWLARMYPRSHGANWHDVENQRGGDMRQSRTIVSKLFTALSIAFIASCGGSGDGSGSVTTRFARSVDFTAVGQGDWTGLFAVQGTGSRYQGLYRASDIGGSGIIRGFSFEISAAAAANTCPNVSIAMAHSTLAALTTTFANNTNADTPVTVFQRASLGIPASAPGARLSFTLDTPFYYNGVDNLIVDISTGACTALTGLKARAAGTPYTALIWDVNSPTPTVGNTWNALATAEFDFSAGTSKLKTAATSATSSVPFTTGTAQRKLQALYPASLVNGNGTLTGIGFPVNATTTAQTYVLTARVGRSQLADLTDTFDSNFSGTPTVVAQNATFRVPAGAPAGEILWIPLNVATFDYNGTDSLLVEIDVTGVSGATAATGLRTSTGNANLVRLLGNSGAATGALSNASQDIALRFTSAVVDVVHTLTAGINVPFSNLSPHRVQYFYDGSQLGVKGRITAIAFRASSSNWTAGAIAYPNLEIVLGQTANAGLNTTLANNLDNPVTVFSGTYTIAAGIAPGDWIDIPLTTAYTLEPAKSLVMQTTLPTPGSVNKSLAAGSGARFPAYIGGGLAPDVSTITTITASSSSQMDLRLTVSP